MHELDEFYLYVEMPEVAKNFERFDGSFTGGRRDRLNFHHFTSQADSSDWVQASETQRRDYMEVQLEYLESAVTATRCKAQGRLLYLLQGEMPPFGLM